MPRTPNGQVLNEALRGGCRRIVEDLRLKLPAGRYSGGWAQDSIKRIQDAAGSLPSPPPFDPGSGIRSYSLTVNRLLQLKYFLHLPSPSACCPDSGSGGLSVFLHSFDKQEDRWKHEQGKRG